MTETVEDTSARSALGYAQRKMRDMATRIAQIEDNLASTVSALERAVSVVDQLADIAGNQTDRLAKVEGTVARLKSSSLNPPGKS